MHADCGVGQFDQLVTAPDNMRLRVDQHATPYNVNLQIDHGAAAIAACAAIQ